eukprot:1806674-Rhodomonas_salina.1
MLWGRRRDSVIQQCGLARTKTKLIGNGGGAGGKHASGRQSVHLTTPRLERLLPGPCQVEHLGADRGAIRELRPRESEKAINRLTLFWLGWSPAD